MLTLKVTFYRLPLSVLVHTVYAQLLIQLTGLSLRFQVARLIQQVSRKSNSEGFLLVLSFFSGSYFFFFYFPLRALGGHVHSGPCLVMTALPVTTVQPQYLFKTKEIVSFSHYSLLPIPSIALQSSR